MQYLLAQVIPSNVEVGSSGWREKEREQERSELFRTIIITLSLILIVRPVLTLHIHACAIRSYRETVVTGTHTTCYKEK